MKTLVRSVALVVCGVVLGTLFVPAAAQQGATDGQIAVRSDGAVYLILNGQRRWVPSLVIDDATLDAIPEAEPIYAGLMPIGSGGSSPPRITGSPSSTGPSGSSGSSSNRGSSATPTRTPTSGRSSSQATATPGASGSTASSSGAVEASLEPIPDRRNGEELKVTSHTNLRRRGSCELRVIYPNGDSQSEDAKVPDSKGECEWKTTVKTSSTGKAKAEVTIREGGDQATAVEEFDIEN
jgi:hypothetical protein